MTRTIRNCRPRGSATPILIIAVFIFIIQIIVAWRMDLQARELRLTSRGAALRWAQLVAAPIAPTDENLADIAEERAQIRRELEALENAMTLNPAGVLSANPHSEETLYFALLSFRERISTRAASAGIAVPPDSGFGFQPFFEAHRVALPLDSDEPSVRGHALRQIEQQQRWLEILLDTLISAHPASIDEVAREPVEGRGRGAKEAMPEVFQIDERISVAVPGMIDTQALRFTFTGQTATLRRFLKDVAELDQLALVRSVRVTPRSSRRDGARKDHLAGALSFAPLGRSPTPAQQDGNDSIPIVQANLSSFTVVVETCSVIGTNGEARSR